jgi:hypothetical protein
VSIEVNGAIILDFTIDSGAADVSAPLDTGQQAHVLADGSMP